MPYVKQEDRDKYAGIAGYQAKTAGELNYLFTMLALNYIKGQGIRYQYYNDVIGALEGCKLELYRRAVAPYEDEKGLENGDVY